MSFGGKQGDPRYQFDLPASSLLALECQRYTTSVHAVHYVLTMPVATPAWSLSVYRQVKVNFGTFRHKNQLYQSFLVHYEAPGRHEATLS